MKPRLNTAGHLSLILYTKKDCYWCFCIAEHCPKTAAEHSYFIRRMGGGLPDVWYIILPGFKRPNEHLYAQRDDRGEMVHDNFPFAQTDHNDIRMNSCELLLLLQPWCAPPFPPLKTKHPIHNRKDQDHWKMMERMIVQVVPAHWIESHFVAYQF